MRRLRFAPLREGVWTRPDNLPRASAPVEWWKAVEPQCGWWTARPDDAAHDLATDLFGAPAWARRAVTLTTRVERVTAALERGGDRALADGFAAGAAALAHIRNDPLLPRELLDDPAAGDALRSAYRRYELAFSSTLRNWFLNN